MLFDFRFLTESLPLIIVLSAVIGGIILTIAAIVIMILCRRSSSLSLKNSKNRGSGVGGIPRSQNGANGANRTNPANSTNKNSPHFRRTKDITEPSDTLIGESPFLKSNGNGFDLGSNHPLITTGEGPNGITEQNERMMTADNWTEEAETSAIDNQQFDRSNSGYNEFSDNQVYTKILYF